MKRRRGTKAAARTRAPRAQTQDATVEVLIERILPGGAGLAHAGGRTIFVGLAAPGDRLRVRINQTRGKAAFASIMEVIEPSPHRAEPPCPYFGRCGGCDFQQLSYEAQLDAKVSIIRDCLRRIARLEPPAEIPITASPSVWHYRSRAQWQFDPQHARLGYFERGSHSVCDVSQCPVLVPELQDALTRLRQRAREGTLPRATEFQAVAGDEGASLSPPVGPTESRWVSRTIGAGRYRFSADGFFQINHELLPSLIEAALGDAQGESAIDLYCGVGLFTLPLARRFARVVGVESNEAAVSDARSNLRAAQLSNAAFEVAKVSEWLKAAAHEKGPVDLILLDPPRAGAEEDAISSIAALRPGRISYVSCDPATLARDLKHLIEHAYRLDSIAAFDMFPQTHHVETVAHLSCEVT
ncbi:MAG TPA: class I SAM-dependent RNA methyltransferase [Pyrinomonadaceae bacterium]|jgi:tRNA/tmRNA/rRNA uracil-C5-methylase (TrmA/RlmC/RlmD family)